jgi:DNA repair exonuclease SbcCD nuclease subunit
MTKTMNRREFSKLAGVAGAGVAGVVFASGLRGVRAATHDATRSDFMFLQMSDTHWGFSGPPVNPDAAGTLEKAVATLNGLERQPDFIVFTGDLTHTTDDPHERRTRLAQFRDIVSKLRVKDIRFMAGEHDASLDAGEGSGHEYMGGEIVVVN